MEWIDWAVSQGFVAVKFHCWNVFEKDLELARAARARFPNLTFMLDVENNYSFADAEAMAAELTALGGYAWFEAPLFDSDTRGYQRLTARSGVDIIPSGNWIQDLCVQQHRHALLTSPVYILTCGCCCRQPQLQGVPGQRLLEPRPVRRGHLRRADPRQEVPRDGGILRHADGGHVLGQHPRLRREPPPHVLLQRLLLLRDGGALRALRVWDAGCDSARR